MESHSHISSLNADRIYEQIPEKEIKESSLAEEIKETDSKSDKIRSRTPSLSESDQSNISDSLSIEGSELQD